MSKPCCEVCTNKRIVIGNNGSAALYCDAKETYVKSDGMCQWYDGERVWRKKNDTKQA